MDSAGKDFHKAELLSIPATILILLIAFGAFVAAVLPVMLALSAFVAAFGLVLTTSHIFPIDQSALSVMLLIGLAVGVDYSSSTSAANAKSGQQAPPPRLPSRGRRHLGPLRPHLRVDGHGRRRPACSLQGPVTSAESRWERSSWSPHRSSAR